MTSARIALRTDDPDTSWIQRTVAAVEDLSHDVPMTVEWSGNDSNDLPTVVVVIRPKTSSRGWLALGALTRLGHVNIVEMDD